MLATRELLRAEHLGKISGKDFVIQARRPLALPLVCLRRFPCGCALDFSFGSGLAVAPGCGCDLDCCHGSSQYKLSLQGCRQGLCHPGLSRWACAVGASLPLAGGPRLRDCSRHGSSTGVSLATVHFLHQAETKSSVPLFRHGLEQRRLCAAGLWQCGRLGCRVAGAVWRQGCGGVRPHRFALINFSLVQCW